MSHILLYVCVFQLDSNSALSLAVKACLSLLPVTVNVNAGVGVGVDPKKGVGESKNVNECGGEDVSSAVLSKEVGVDVDVMMLLLAAQADVNNKVREFLI